MQLTKNQLSTLSQVFSPVIIRELLKFGYSEKLFRIIRDCNLEEYTKSFSLRSLFEFCHDVMSKKYPNEYIYKNAIANKILLGKHSLNTSFMLTEFRANNSKVDCVIINGTLTVYEIKTELDNFNRLEKQIEDYKKVFEKIYVITAEKHIDKIDFLTRQGIGIMRLNRNGKISTIKEAESQFEHLDLSVIFDSLRQSEYTKIIQNIYGYIPNVPNTRIYLVCKELFSKIEKKIAYKEVIKYLKQRGCNKSLKDFIEQVPKSLKARAIDDTLTAKERIRFLEILGSNVINLIKKG